MTDGQCQPVAVSRRIAAPAHSIFEILANPVRHPEFDGSGALRGARTTTVISGVGDVFVMKMYYDHLGDYESNNHVVEYEPDRRIGWEPEAGHGHPAAAAEGGERDRWRHRWSYQLTPDGPDATVVTEIYDCSRAPQDARAMMDNGNVWRQGMATTLQRLDALCTHPGLHIIGSLRSAGGKGVVRMQDRFGTTIDDVWSALTDPRRLAHWYGEITGDLRAGGEYHAHLTASGWEGTGRIEVCEPPRRLRTATKESDGPGEGGTEVTLTADGGQTVLVAEEWGMPLELIAAYGAGVQIHVEDLASYLAGRDRGDVEARWKELQPAYERLAADLG